jgi:hypothetical protein
MPPLKIAHINVQGQDMIIAPLDRGFGSKTDEDRREALAEIEARARSAGLKGHAVAVWDAGGGRMAFHAPTPWHPYFQSINLQTVFANVNRELSW